MEPWGKEPMSSGYERVDLLEAGAESIQSRMSGSAQSRDVGSPRVQDSAGGASALFSGQVSTMKPSAAASRQCLSRGLRYWQSRTVERLRSLICGSFCRMNNGTQTLLVVVVVTEDCAD